MGGEDIKKEIVSWRREKKIATRVGTDRDPVATSKAFVRSAVVLFLALYRVY